MSIVTTLTVDAPVAAEERQATTVAAPLRVLSIAHTAVSRAAGRLRYDAVGARGDVEAHLVVPDRWYQFGRWLVADPPEHEPGVEVHVSRVRWPRAGRACWYLHHYPELGKLVSRTAPDVIHLWEEPYSLVALHAAWLRRRLAPDAALVLEVDQNLLKRLPPPFEAARRWVLSQTDLLLARNAEAEAVCRACGYDGPSMPIGYGVDQTRFRPMDRAGSRAAFGLSGFVLGYVGRLVEEKGLDDALDALALTRHTGCAPAVTLAIMGEGPHEAALRSRAEKLGVASRVRFLPWGNPERVALFLNALDALALLTRTTRDVREQFGRVIIEAHSCGVPVIGSSSGAIPEVVGNGGWIVPERGAMELAELLDQLRRQPALCTQAAMAGRRQVAERYTYPAIAEVLSTGWRAARERRRRARA